MLVPTALAFHGERSESADKVRLDKGKLALKKLLEERRKEKLESKGSLSVLEYLRIYGSIIASLFIIGGIGSLLFLVPMIIDPAVATLNFNFVHKPVVVEVMSFRQVLGISNISWCSCTEACTKDIYSCYQIEVGYNKLYDSRNLMKGHAVVQKDSDRSSQLDEYSSSPPSTTTTTLKSESELVRKKRSQDYEVPNAKLLVNIKGCGYPPQVNCSKFKESYGLQGRLFYGYYSEVDPYIVLANFSPDKVKKDLLESLGYTCGAQLLGVVILLLLHCPYRRIWRRLFRKKKRRLNKESE